MVLRVLKNLEGLKNWRDLEGLEALRPLEVGGGPWRPLKPPGGPAAARLPHFIPFRKKKTIFSRWELRA